MGLAKNQMIEYQERGYGSLDKMVCSDCVGDYALKNYIIENGESDTCSYCSNETICISGEELIGEIMSGIFYEYEKAINVMSVEKGEYKNADTWGTYDLIYDHLAYDMELDDDLLDDVYNTIEDDIWCERDPYRLRENSEKLSLWDEFCKMVKEKTRYVFFRMPERDEYNEDAPFTVLDYIGEKVEKLALIEEVPSNTRFFRARMHNEEETFEFPKDICSPPSHKAKSNRMSAEGISIFYGANNTRTSILEIYDPKYTFVTVAEFFNLRQLIILDLTKIGPITFPSLFDRKNRENRQAILFLRKLNENIVRPIDTMESIEYIPAQIVAEYFRYIYLYRGIHIDGIKYGSSKDDNGICYALFFNNKQCKESNERFRFEQQELKLVPDSITKYRVTMKNEIEYIKVC